MRRNDKLSLKLEKLVSAGVALTANYEPVSPVQIAEAVTDKFLDSKPEFIYGSNGSLLGLNYVLAA